jgi:ectoine hydroxylase-related dioxygenase (phytanoyl-CoA dioxygenase family)
MRPATAGSNYGRDGFTTFAAALDLVTVEAALDHLTACRARYRLPPDAAMVAVPLSEPYAAGLAADDRLVTVASRLLGAPAVAFGFTYLCKSPRSGPPALWHQDGGPWAQQLGGADALTVWIALDATDTDNGCLQVIPGSHLLDAQPLQRATSAPSLFGVEIDPALVDYSRAVSVPLHAADLSVHHPQLIHGSGPNRSERPRRALAIRYRAGPDRPGP